MWKQTKPPHYVLVTTEVAKQWAEKTPVPNDRPLNDRRVLFYHNLFKDGLMRSVSWATVKCVETGETYRVNGKHTSTMLSDLKVIPEFYASVEEYEADTLEDVAHLYGTFDSRMQMRTCRDINRSFAAASPELANLPCGVINAAVSGISYAKWNENAFSKTPMERAETLFDHVDFVVWLNSFGGAEKGSNGFLRSPVVAAMFLSYEKSRVKANEFWKAVRDETGISPDLPDRKLAKWLSQFSVIQGSHKKSQYKADRKEFLVRCIHSWNAWRKNEPTKLQYFPDKKVPTLV